MLQRKTFFFKANINFVPKTCKIVSFKRRTARNPKRMKNPAFLFLKMHISHCNCRHVGTHGTFA